MRKPRDFDAELSALNAKAKQLKARRIQQLGELVIATGADALDAETLAGALLAARKADTASTEGWRRAGARFFQGTRRTSNRAAVGGDATASREDDEKPSDAATGKA